MNPSQDGCHSAGGALSSQLGCDDKRRTTLPRHGAQGVGASDIAQDGKASSTGSACRFEGAGAL